MHFFVHSVHFNEAKQLTLVALEGSAYPSELCPKGCKRGETGLFSTILDALLTFKAKDGHIFLAYAAFSFIFQKFSLIHLHFIEVVSLVS